MLRIIVIVLMLTGCQEAADLQSKTRDSQLVTERTNELWEDVETRNCSSFPDTDEVTKNGLLETLQYMYEGGHQNLDESDKIDWCQQTIMNVLRAGLCDGTYTAPPSGDDETVLLAYTSGVCQEVYDEGNK